MNDENRHPDQEVNSDTSNKLPPEMPLNTTPGELAIANNAKADANQNAGDDGKDEGEN